MIKRRLSDENYIVATPHRRRSTQLYHVNLLKPYYEKSKSNSESSIHSVLLAVSDVKNFCSGRRSWRKRVMNLMIVFCVGD